MDELKTKRIIQLVLILIGCFSFYMGATQKYSWQGLHVLGYFIITASCIIGIIWLETKNKS